MLYFPLAHFEARCAPEALGQSLHYSCERCNFSNQATRTTQPRDTSTAHRLY